MRKTTRIFNIQDDGKIQIECNKCKKVKDSSEFYVKYKNRPALEKSHWMEKCIECATVYRADFYDKNKDRLNEESKSAYWEDREHYLEKQRDRKFKFSKDPEALLHRRSVQALNEFDRYIYDKVINWKRNAGKRKLEWKLEISDIHKMWNDQNGLCFYSKLPMICGPNDNLTISLDRIDSKLGYQKGNVVLCGSIINSMKLDLEIKEFKELIKTLHGNFHLW